MLKQADLHLYADKIVNLLSAHTRKLYKPQQSDLLKVEHALSVLEQSINLELEDTVYDLMYTGKYDNLSGFNELLIALRTIIDKGEILSQSGGGGT
jgi:hypothetical protein